MIEVRSHPFGAYDEWKRSKRSANKVINGPKIYPISDLA